jgi:hypothetical protein
MWSLLVVAEQAALTSWNIATPEAGENVSFGKLSELRKDDGPKPSVLSTPVI